MKHSTTATILFLALIILLGGLMAYSMLTSKSPDKECKKLGYQQTYPIEEAEKKNSVQVGNQTWYKCCRYTINNERTGLGKECQFINLDA